MEFAIVWWEVIPIGGAVLGYGICEGVEVALLSARKSLLLQWKEAGQRNAALAYDMRERPERFLTTVRILATAMGVLASGLAGALAVTMARPNLVIFVVVILVLTYVGLVLGQLVPRALAHQHPERVLCWMARPLTVLTWCCGVFRTILMASSTFVLWLLGHKYPQDFSPIPVITEEEVTSIIREGAERGIFEEVEQELIEGVFEFADTAAREIMVPRVRIQAMEVTTPAGEVIPKFVELGHTRVPVYSGDLDHIVGVLLLKDVLRVVDRGAPWTVRNLLHPPLYVPETAQISRLLRTLQQRRLNMAIVVDEHGGVAGLVTIEDLLEQLVGDIRDEGEPLADALVMQLYDGSLVIQGNAPLWELQERFALPVEESSDYQTLAGLLLVRFGHIPQGGETIAEQGYTFTVVDMDGPRIARVKVERRTADSVEEVALDESSPPEEQARPTAESETAEKGAMKDG